MIEDDAQGPIVMPPPSLARGAMVQAVFEGHERRICQLANNSMAVVGCMAWVTNRRILRAFGDCPCGVSIVMHDDSAADRLDANIDALETNTVYPKSVECDGPDTPMDLCEAYVRFRGVELGNETRAMMHAKFLVFCDIDKTTLIPQVVWVGSTNLTHNSTRNIEAGVVIADEATAKAFASMWKSCLAIAVSGGIHAANWRASR